MDAQAALFHQELGVIKLLKEQMMERLERMRQLKANLIEKMEKIISPLHPILPSIPRPLPLMNKVLKLNLNEYLQDLNHLISQNGN